MSEERKPKDSEAGPLLIRSALQKLADKSSATREHAHEKTSAEAAPMKPKNVACMAEESRSRSSSLYARRVNNFTPWHS